MISPILSKLLQFNSVGRNPVTEMIVCSCNYITRKDIEEVIIDILDKDEWQLITAGVVYHAMNKRGKCCGCFPRLIDIIVETTAQYHARKASPHPQVAMLLDRIREVHGKVLAFKQNQPHQPLATRPA